MSATLESITEQIAALDRQIAEATVSGQDVAPLEAKKAELVKRLTEANKALSGELLKGSASPKGQVLQG